ncbi:hypothetical protein EDC94DRAFT_579772 [Helicostylum pulchrum]|nr:hypothetical protein EDC94DRAFT_579772 [Helicostylum pulchrum]
MSEGNSMLEKMTIMNIQIGYLKYTWIPLLHLFNLLIIRRIVWPLKYTIILTRMAGRLPGLSKEEGSESRNKLQEKLPMDETDKEIEDIRQYIESKANHSIANTYNVYLFKLILPINIINS